jgi:hypothetical protein
MCTLHTVVNSTKKLDALKLVSSAFMVPPLLMALLNEVVRYTKRERQQAA